MIRVLAAFSSNRRSVMNSRLFGSEHGLMAEGVGVLIKE
jgi:hypothetical protein